MNSDDPRPCPICASANVVVVGPILHPQPTKVAGIALDLGTERYSLLRCVGCGFQFKDPIIDENKLLACYAAADSDNWGESPDPWERKFDVLREVVESYASGPRVLDIGCFNGAFLASLGSQWDIHGIEPSRAAAELAIQRNVRIVGSTLADVEAMSGCFDVVLAIDVVEHIVEPMSFFRQVSRLLAPSGVFIVATGDTSGLAWRWQRSAYWYCSLPEHVSFYNDCSLDRIGQTLGLARVEYRQLRPRRKSSWRLLCDGFKNVTYVVVRAAKGFGIPSLYRLFVERHGPSVQTAKDHLIYVFRRSA